MIAEMCCPGSPDATTTTADRLAAETTIDLPRVEAAVREILRAIGEDPDRDGLRDTPSRVARAYREIFGGLHADPAEHLGRVFEQDGGDVITVCNIDFASMCEHHLLPFLGQAHIAYVPGRGKVVGLSKLARTVEVFARRPQIQERLTAQIAGAITEHLDAEGVLVMVEAEHLCMKMRGVRTAASSMITYARRGVFQTDEARGREIATLLTTLAQRAT